MRSAPQSAAPPQIRRRTRAFTGAIAGIALGVGLTAAPTAAAAPSPSSVTAAKPKPGGVDLAKTVTGEAVYAHLEEFSKIAANNGGNRAVGTPGYEASAQYVEEVLTEAGYTPERQTFDVDNFTVDSFSLEVTGVELDPAVMSYSASTPSGGVTTELATPTDALGCDAAAYEGADVTGDIVVVSRGTCAFSAKAEAAGQAGAAAVIVYNNVDGALNGTLGGTVDGSAPAIGVTQAEGASLLEAIAAGPVSATLELSTTLETIETFNILAETSTGRDDNVVVVGAHLDGAPEGPGINDNASGSAATLETAVQLAKSGTLNNKVRFAWWGAEEIGLLGSEHYVSDLVANDPEGLDSIATYLNFDMVGSPNYTIGVYDADQSTYEAPVDVPEGSIETEAIFTDYFDSIDQPWVDSEFSGRSDYQAFITNGIPASGLFTGADSVKTEEEAAIFGGTAGDTLDPNYHTAADDLDNVSQEALDIMAPAIGHATQALAKSTETINGEVGAPVWDAKAKYKKGALVYYQGKLFKALWAAHGPKPGSLLGPWAEVGETVTCGSVTSATWTKTGLYVHGDTVVHNGKLWKQILVSRGLEPGKSWLPLWKAVRNC